MSREKGGEKHCLSKGKGVKKHYLSRRKEEKAFSE